MSATKQQDGFEEVAYDVDMGEEPKGFAASAAYAFTINYIFGAGVLGVPFAVAHAGIMGASVCLVFFSAMSAVAAIWVVEACARGEAYVSSGRYKMEQPSADWANLSASFTASFNGEEDRQRASMMDGTADDKATRMLEDSSSASYEITTRRFEVAELAQMFLGKSARAFYDTSVTLFSLVSMWLYAALFAISLAQTLPLPFITKHDCMYDAGLWNVPGECRLLYWTYLAIFFCMMLAVTMVDLSGQVALQKTLTAMAFSCVALMVVTVIVAIASTEGGHMHEPGREFKPATVLFDIGGFGKAFSCFVFAQLCHHGIPGLIQLMANKESCKKVFTGAISTTCSIYLLLGIPCAIFFGQSTVVDQGVNKVITLNWGSYSEGLMATPISYIVRLYPAISVFAAFPLYANTLATNWEMALPECVSRGPKVTQMVRWAAVLPGIIGASLMSDASLIISIGGLFGFMIELIMPALLSIVSARKCRKELGGDAKTPYGWHFSHDCYAYGVLAFSAVALVYAVVTLVLSMV